MLEEVLELAARAPSFSNTQPWEVTVIGGEVMEQVKKALVQAASSGVPSESHISYPNFTEPYLSRRRETGYKLYEVLGIDREDMQSRKKWSLQGRDFFGAPNGMIFYLEDELGLWSLYDLGLFSQSVMLAALSFGLGTCALAAAVNYPRILQRISGIPDTKKIVCGMAIGYPDWQFPANKKESPREPVATFSRWCGF
ncbi:nitroreductase [Chloroflexota bacterium]